MQLIPTSPLKTGASSGSSPTSSQQRPTSPAGQDCTGVATVVVAVAVTVALAVVVGASVMVGASVGASLTWGCGEATTTLEKARAARMLRKSILKA